MADIELVIKITEKAYNLLKTSGVDWLGAEHILDAVANGIPLPKGHGRLTDLDKLIGFTYDTYGINSGKCMTKDNEVIINYIYNKTETIIEADKKQEDGNDD